MTHSHIEHPSDETLAAFVEGRLSDPSSVETHVDGCEECARIVLGVERIELMSSLGLIPALTAEQLAAKRELLGKWLQQPTTPKGDIERVGPLTESKRGKRQAWLAVAIAVCVLCAVGGVLEFRLIITQRREIERLTAERDQAHKELERLVQKRRPEFLVPTNDRQTGTGEWAKVVSAFYDEKLSDEENLTSLANHGGETVRATIAELRQRKPSPTSKEILQELFRVFGGPQQP